MLLLLSCGSFLASQSWRSSLYPEDWSPPTLVDSFYTRAFIQDFSYAGYHRGERPIPTVTDNLIDVTQSPFNADASGAEDATAAIQAAIDRVQAEGGGVVYLPAGTYRLSVPEEADEALYISHSGVILRGDGTDSTFLYNSTTQMRRKQIIRIEPDGGRNWDRYPDAGDFAFITQDLTGPTTVIPVSATELFEVGDEVILRSLMTESWVEEHHEDPEWTPHLERLDGIIQYRVVTAVGSGTVTIDAPTKYAFMMSDGAILHPSRSNMIEEIGLENFSIGNREIVAASPSDWLEADGTLDNGDHNREGQPAYQTHASSAIKIDRVQNSWVRNVSSYRHPDNVYSTHLLSNGIKLEMSSRVTLDNVFMGYGQYGGGGGNSYGFRIESNDCLFVNCRTAVNRHGFSIVRIWSSGNVLHRVHDADTGLCTANETSPIRTGSSGSDFHQWFSPSNLIDQMTVDDSYFSAVHRKGVSQSATQPGHNAVTAQSVFWNFTADGSRNGYAIRTSQTKNGYVIGTRGSTPGVNNKPTDPVNLLNLEINGDPPAFRYDIGGVRTMPFDTVEGVGMAATLEPQSLYLDQLARRLDPTSLREPRPVSPLAVFPNPSRIGRFWLTEDQAWVAYAIDGRRIATGSEAEVDISRQAPGVYVIRAGERVARVLIR